MRYYKLFLINYGIVILLACVPAVAMEKNSHSLESLLPPKKRRSLKEVDAPVAAARPIELPSIDTLQVQTSEQEKRLFIATQKGQEAVVAQLIHENPSLINTISPVYGFTPLHAAASIGNIKIAKLLIRAGAYLNIPAQGKTPLQIALAKGNEVMITFLIAEQVKKTGPLHDDELELLREYIDEESSGLNFEGLPK